MSNDEFHYKPKKVSRTVINANGDTWQLLGVDLSNAQVVNGEKRPLVLFQTSADGSLAPAGAMQRSPLRRLRPPLAPVDGRLPLGSNYDSRMLPPGMAFVWHSSFVTFPGARMPQSATLPLVANP